MNHAIVAENVGKQFRRYDDTRPDTFIEAFTRGFRHLRAGETFWSLRGVSFTVEKGEALGIIGHNGAGKSTLLRMLGLVSKPDEGTVFVDGSIGGFLDLTAGFRDELTGRENVFVSGIISGLTRRQVAERFDQIVAFSEIENFIDSPLRTYSTGMRMRLAFAVAAHTSPDILLIDEVLTVGDLAFRHKCFERIEQFRSDGVTIVIVSHNMGEIVKICSNVVWLEQGRVKAVGKPRAVLKDYFFDTEQKTGQITAGGLLASDPEHSALLSPPASERQGTKQAMIARVQLGISEQRPEGSIASSDPLEIQLKYVIADPVIAPQVQISIVDQQLQPCCRTHTTLGDEGQVMAGKGSVSLAFQRLDLAPGRYFINMGLYSHDWETVYDLHWRVYPLDVVGTANGTGILSPPHRWQHST